jgi:hypothetical protein
VSLVAIYALVWSVYAVLIFGAFHWIAPPRSPRTSFARALLWSAALNTLGELAAIPWEPGRVCAFSTGLFLLAWLKVRVGVIRAFAIVVATLATWLGFCAVAFEVSRFVSFEAISIAVSGVIFGAWGIRLLTSRA